MHSSLKGVIGCLLCTATIAGYALPPGFVYLDEVAPNILQDMRYASVHNFVGSGIEGYEASACILTQQAATALANAEAQLRPFGLGLKVYDCYRPQSAVDQFIEWSHEPDENIMQAEFYPNLNKSDLFSQGYVVAPSSHTRGSTVDVTMVPIPTPREAVYQSGEPLVSCVAPYEQRFHDNSVDMGTGYDCMDPLSRSDNQVVGKGAYQNRMRLRLVMEQNGFAPYDNEWWHFTLKNEPYPLAYFDFPVE